MNSQTSKKSLAYHWIHFLFLTAAFGIASLAMTFVGWFVVAARVQHPRIFPDTEKPFSDPEQEPGTWMLARLSHDWMLWWDNVYDGLQGDKRGWWNTYCLDNYFERNVIGTDRFKGFVFRPSPWKAK